jgi:hypothetical protein
VTLDEAGLAAARPSSEHACTALHHRIVTALSFALYGSLLLSPRVVEADMHLTETMSSDRRSILKGLAAAAMAPLAAPAMAAEGLVAPPAGSAAAIATDKAYWADVKRLYAVTADVVNFENGYWGIMAEPVRREFIRQSDMINYQNTYYARLRAGADFDAVRARVAEAVGAAVEEIALTRGATEALQLLIGGYNRLKPGDGVLYADLDYDSMQYAMNALRARRGVDVVRFDVPEPATRQAVLDAYARAIEANPKTRLLLLDPCQPPHRPRDADRRDRPHGEGQGHRHHCRRRAFLGADRLPGE